MRFRKTIPAWMRKRPTEDRNLWLDPGRRGRVSEPSAAPTHRRRLSRRGKLVLFAGLLAVAAPLAAWGVRSGRFAQGGIALDEALALERVSVEGNRRAPAAELVTATGLTAGVPLHAIDVDTVQALVESHPWIAQAQVVRLPPSVVLVSVTERAPVAVAAMDGGEPWLVDARGLPFASAHPDDVAALPWLAVGDPVRERVISTELARGAALAELLQQTGVAAGAEIHVAPPPDPDGLWLLVAGMRGRVVLGHGGLREKLRKLEQLRISGLPEAPAAAVIDLRFADRAVLRSAAPPASAQITLGTPPAGASPPPGRRL